MAKVGTLRFKRNFSKVRTCPACRSRLKRRYARTLALRIRKQHGGKKHESLMQFRGQVPRRFWECRKHGRIARPVVRTVT